MDTVHQALLVASSSADAAAVYQRFARILPEADCEVHRAPPGNEALDLLKATAFDLVLVAFPLADPPMRELLRTVRWRESASRHASVLLVVLESLAAAQELLERGVNRVVRVDSPDTDLRRAVHDLLEVAPRLSLRAIVRLAVQRGAGVERTMAQTDNVSLSGMLVRGSQSYPRGTRVQFELPLPGLLAPLVGEGDVVRSTAQGRESVRGFAVRFVSLAGDGRKRLAEFLLNRPEAAAREGKRA